MNVTEKNKRLKRAEKKDTFQQLLSMNCIILP